MIKNNEPYLIEYNIRMGDPECQVIIPRLNTDILKIFNAAVANKLNKFKNKMEKNKSYDNCFMFKGISW